MVASKEARRKWLTERRNEINEIGEIPKIGDEERRRACELDPKLWLRTYHPEHFFLQFSKSQSEFIDLAWSAIVNRSYQNVNAYRSFGKTTILSGLLEMSMLTGRSRCAMYISSVDSMSADARKFFSENIQQDPVDEDGIWSPENPLSQDYPEVCYPFAKRDRIAQKPLTHQGRRCDIEDKPDRVRFPTILGSRCNASLLMFTSIASGNIRGKRHQIPGEGTFRPDTVMLDDIQSDGTAKSEKEVTNIMTTISKSVEGLAGYDRETHRKTPLTIMSALTQNQPDDVAIRMAERPEYFTKIYKFLPRVPDDFEPWRAYRDFKNQIQFKLGRKELVLPELQRYYREHQSEIERGVEVDNPEIFEEGQINAIHFALDFWCRSEEAFWCELQNDAKRAKEETGGMLVPVVVTRKLRPVNTHEGIEPLKRRQVPENTEIMTAFIDCGEHYLNYQVTAFGKAFEFAHVVDFGVFPDQNYPVTKKNSYRVDIQDAYTRGDKFDRLGDAVVDCLQFIFDQDYRDHKGRLLNVFKETDYQQHAICPGRSRKPYSLLSCCGVDCSDGDMEMALWGAVDRFHSLSQGKYFGKALPCYGSESKSRLMRFYDLKVGEWRRGRTTASQCDWIENPNRCADLTRYYANVYTSLLYDANTAKSRRDRAWLTDVERSGAESIFYWPEPDYIRMYAEHQCSEEWVEGWLSNLRYKRWKMKRPRTSDNEFLDTDAGCWALASLIGIEFASNVSNNRRLNVKWG